MADEPTKAELYAEARDLGIKGFYSMNKAALSAAIAITKGVHAELEPSIEVVELPELIEAPVFSQGPTTQGGLTFLTDRSQ